MTRACASLGTIPRQRRDRIKGQVNKKAGRERACPVGNQHVQIGKEGYYLSADGLLMPAKKDQPPPDLRYFKASQK